MAAEPGIYRIDCSANGRMYVGSSVNPRKRWAAHQRHLRAGVHTNPQLQRAWARYGEAAFSFEIIEVGPKSDLLVREQYWMDVLSAVERGFNLCPQAGRPGGRQKPHSEATKAKIRAKRALQIMLPEAAVRTAAALRGRPRPQHVKEAISAANAGRVRTPEERAAIASSLTGRQTPAGVRARISDALRAFYARAPRSPEHCAALSAALQGKKLSPESIAKRTASRRANNPQEQSV